MEWPLVGSVDHFSWSGGSGPQTGIISSPNYPAVYPQSTDKSYVLLGAPHGQIHLSFRAFRLDIHNPSK